MLGSVAKLSAKPQWLGLGLITLLALALSLNACSDSAGLEPEESPVPAEDTATIGHGAPEFYGAATAPLILRIHDSDVIVRASLLSAKDDTLKFEAVEYLKGTGAGEITVRASTDGRETTWDGREAVIFLKSPVGQGASGASAQESFIFTQTDRHYTGTLPSGYMAGERNPVWLPAKEGSGVGGLSGGNQEFVTGSESAAISLADLRSMIAWVEGGEGIDGYEECITSVLAYEVYYGDWEAFYGRPYEPAEFEERIASGSGAGLTLFDPSFFKEPGYSRYWITGPDADLFRSLIRDDDELASTGYSVEITTGRPLPSGSYAFTNHGHRYEFMPCEFVPTHNRLDIVVMVTPPEGTLHESFFDPVTIGSGAGAEGSRGVLEPTGFHVGGTATSMTSLAWENRTAVLTLTPHVSLSGKEMDVIELDGSVSLTLDFDEATENTGAGTYNWSVAKQPWDDGDLLMLRIRD